MVIEDQIIRVDVWPGSKLTTQNGLGIGSTIQAVEAQYPNKIEVTPHAHIRDGQYLTFDPADDGENLYQIVFETDSYGRVILFRAGQFPAVSWFEGCS